MKYTPEKLRVELLEARARGRMAEVRDVTLLLSHAMDPIATQFRRPEYTDALKAARNRQSQRRHHRDRMDRGWGQGSRWREGDYVIAPDGSTMVLEAREADTGVYVCRRMTDAVGTGTWRLSADQMRRPPAGESPVAYLSRASDALYHAFWDRLDGGTDDAAKAALAAYEASLASLGL